jgi:hypothetical protein
MIFLYVLISTFIGSTNFLTFHLQMEGGSNPLVSQTPTWRKLQLPNYLAPTKRRLQPPSFSGSNLKEATTPFFFFSKQKEATTPYVLQIQPEGGYNHLSLPHLTTLKYKCRNSVTTNESTIANVNLPFSTYHKNLSQQPIITTYHINLSQSTYHINLINQARSNHQDKYKP